MTDFLVESHVSRILNCKINLQTITSEIMVVSHVIHKNVFLMLHMYKTMPNISYLGYRGKKFCVDTRIS